MDGSSQCKGHERGTMQGRPPFIAAHPDTATCLGKSKHTPPCSSEELFFAEKNRGHRRKISVVDMAFLGFCRGFLPTTGLESFPLRPEKLSKILFR